MKRIEMKVIHGELVPVTIYPAVEREEVGFVPARSKTNGWGGKVKARVAE